MDQHDLVEVIFTGQVNEEWIKNQSMIYEKLQSFLPAHSKVVLPNLDLIREVSRIDYGPTTHYLIPAGLTIKTLSTILIETGIVKNVYIGGEKNYKIQSIPTTLKVVSFSQIIVTNKRVPRNLLPSVEETLMWLLAAKLLEDKQSLSFLDDKYIVCRNVIEPLPTKQKMVLDRRTSVHPQFDQFWIGISTLLVGKEISGMKQRNIFFPQEI